MENCIVQHYSGTVLVSAMTDHLKGLLLAYTVYTNGMDYAIILIMNIVIMFVLSVSCYMTSPTLLLTRVVSVYE